MLAIVTGVGPGLGAALCRHFCANGISVAGLARSTEFGTELERELVDCDGSFRFYRCDVTDPASVPVVIERIRSELGTISILIHNAGAVKIAAFLETPVEDFKRLWEVNCLGAAIAAGAVLPGMLSNGGGTMIFTSATAALRGSANFSAFASSKFALRGLVQSLAREFGPKGIHVSNVIVDGLIWGPKAEDRFGALQDQCLNPDEIAAQYLNLIKQDRSVWTQELDLRPYSETF